MKSTAFKLIAASIALLSMLAIGAEPLYAQDDQQAPPAGKPKPAAKTYPVPIIGPDDQQQDQNNQLVPDNTPLTGVQTPTLGTEGVNHSYWMPGIQWSGSVQSFGYQQTQNSNANWLMNNYFIGNLSLLKFWGRSQLSANYSAGGFVSTDSTQGNGYYQNLALTQSFNWNRWQLQLIDQFSYLPESSFGFGGGSGLGAPGAGGPLGPVIPGLGGGYVPNQSIYAALGPRYSNASAVQLTYLTSPRGSITLSGSYGLLNFVDAGNVDNDSITGTVGYNYALNRSDTLGVFYRFSSYHYPGQPQAMGDHSVNVAYGKKITGHVALQLYAGPDFTTSRISMNGRDLSSGVNAGANIQYGIERGSFTLGYSHGVSGGSGILIGTTSDVVNTSISHQLSREWSGQANFGYARNSSIGIASQVNSLTFNSYTIGAGLSRPFGRNATFAFAYNVNIPDYTIPGCTGAGCSSNQKLQYITLNFQWRTRPFVLP